MKPVSTEVAYINVYGEKIDATGKVIPRKRDAAAQDVEYHNGFVVQGHRIGECDSARLSSAKALLDWDAMSDQDRDEEIKRGKRRPREFDEARWRIEAPKHKVRNRPFSIESAARQMVDLATKAGWEDLEIVELKRQKQQ